VVAYCRVRKTSLTDVAETITREAAEAALAAQDWPTATKYWAQLQDHDMPAADAWLNAVEVAAMPDAIAGEKHAQSTLAFVCVMRHTMTLAPDPEQLRTALHWFMAAARHDGADIMIEQVVVWYGYGNRPGSSFHDEAVEAFLLDPDVRERYRLYRGPDNGLERRTTGNR
jgi:hypothetical protein